MTINPPTTEYEGWHDPLSEEKDGARPDTPAAKTIPRANPDFERETVEAGQVKLDQVI